ncbi:MAG: DUF512 domain-containing protein [Candidatus Syntrophosphaera sp.]|nr:DUF512 domain-containing protein [Candidatus Syntrophosphaera sp.]
MPLLIAEVQPRSLAAKAGIEARDTILSINSMPVNDFFDLEYYANDYQLDFELRDTQGQPKSATVLRQSSKALGIGPEPHTVSRCRNNCIFCFIDQMPPKLRPSLYLKDDDYLYSYVFGNYITLNNLNPAEIKRIAGQHISPLYISVHTTDPALRGKLMRGLNQPDVLATLRELAGSGIDYHLQIVCVPGYNDGGKLRETLRDLSDGSLSTLSVGVVPVGLTRFREGLTPLRPFDENLARETVAIIEEFRIQNENVYAADELFVLAGLSIPGPEYYGDFPQLENGIGMLRLMQMNFQRRKRALAKELDKAAAPFLMLTSRLAFGTVAAIAEDLNGRLNKSQLRVQALRNDFFGEHISVSGLLTASDILSQHTAATNEGIILPSSIFNHEGVTLDDVSQVELKAKLQRPLLLIDQFCEDWEWL